MSSRVRALVAARGGLATRSDLVADGASAAAIDRALRSGRLLRAAPGVYALELQGGAAARLRTALLAAGPDVVASHRTAAWLWGLLAGPRDSELLHLTIPHGRWRRRVSGTRVHQSGDFEMFHKGEWPVTRPRRTLIDLAGQLTERDFRFVALDAVHRGLVDLAQLTDVGGVPRPWRRVWREVGHDALAGAASGGEAEYRRLLVDSDLPLPVLNQPIHTHRGRYVVDAWWATWRLAAEVDGRAHHTREWQFEADRQRQNDLHASGVVLIRFPVSQILADPGEVLRMTELNLLSRAEQLRSPLQRRVAAHGDGESLSKRPASIHPRSAEPWSGP